MNTDRQSENSLLLKLNVPPPRHDPLTLVLPLVRLRPAAIEHTSTARGHEAAAPRERVHEDKGTWHAPAAAF